jgi:hypothetical protein
MYMKIYIILCYKFGINLSLKLFNLTVQILIPHKFDTLPDTTV